MLKLTKIEPKTLNTITVIYGDAGIGKTALAMTAENPLYISLDGSGLARSGNAHIEHIEPANIKELQDVTAEDLAQYRTVVIDTLVGLTDLITQGLPKDGKIRQLDGQLSMKGWGVVGNMAVDTFKHFTNLGKDVIILAHIDEKIDDEGNWKIAKPSSSGQQAFKFILKNSDLIGMLDSKRVLHFERPMEFTKTNLDVAILKGGLAPQKIVLDDFGTLRPTMAEIQLQIREKYINESNKKLKNIKTLEVYKNKLEQYKNSPNDIIPIIQEIAKKEKLIAGKLFEEFKSEISEKYEYDKENKSFTPKNNE